MSRVVASLALVKSAMDLYKRDYIENFLPFIATLIVKNNFLEVDLRNIREFSELFKNEFGLNIPYHPMSTILNRARKRGLFIKKYGQLLPNRDVILKYDFSDSAIKKEAEFNKIINEFIGFCKERYQKTFSDIEANDIFLFFLHQHDLSILFASQEKGLIPSSFQSRSNLYLIAAFINYLRKNDYPIFQNVLDVAIGHVLASCILYNDNLIKITGKLSGLEIYLDCDILFHLLGVNGIERKDAYEEFIRSLNSQNAKLFVFTHTHDEALRIMNNAIPWIDNPNYDPSRASSVLRFFKEKSMTISDAELFIFSFEKVLERHNITIKNAPDFNKTRMHQIDQIKFKKMINEKYSEHNEYFNMAKKESTIDKDIKSIASIHHLRKGRLVQSLNRAGYIFVTTNWGLACISKVFETKENSKTFFIPTCLTDFFIGTIVWMQSPIRWISLNEKRFISSCYSALQPCDNFIKRFVDECNKLLGNEDITEDEFRMLTETNVARELLMKKTLGDPDQFNPKTIREIVDEITNKAIRGSEERAIKEEKEKKLLQHELHRIQETDKKKKITFNEKTAVLAKCLSNIVILIIFFIVIASTIYLYFDVGGIIFYVCLAITVIVLIFSFVYGRNLMNLRKIIVGYTTDVIKKFFKEY